MSESTLQSRLSDWWKTFDLSAHLPNKLADIPTDEDQLGYSEFVEAIANKIVNAIGDGGTPFTIGIHGAWGSGKTSFLKLIEKELRKEKIKPIWFNAWKYNQEDNLWSALLQRILDQAPLNHHFLVRPFIRIRLARQNWNLKAGGFELFKKTLSLLARILLLLICAGIAKGFFSSQISVLLDFIASRFPAIDPSVFIFIQSKLTRWVSAIIAAIIVIGPKDIYDVFSDNLGVDISKFDKKRSYKNHIAYLDEFNDDFRKTIKIVSGKKPLVVFIDDLDRCLPEKSLQILEAMKLFLDVESCIFVVAVDREIVEQAVSARYFKEIGQPEINPEQPLRKLDTAFLAQNYIEKIIQLPFTVPPLPSEKIKGYVNFLYPHEDNDKCGEIFAVSLPPNPRKIKRVIQSFMLLKEIAKRRLKDEKVNFSLLAKLVIIENQFRGLHRDLINTPALLDGIERSHRKDEENLPDCVMIIYDRLDYQEKVNSYSGNLDLRKLLLQSVKGGTFIGVDFSEYIFLLKTVSDESSRRTEESVITQIQGSNVIGPESIGVSQVAIGAGTISTIEGEVVEKIDAISGNIVNNYVIENKSTINSQIGGSAVLSPLEALRFYLDNLIATHQQLRLQGIRAGSQPLSVPLENIYVPLEVRDMRLRELNRSMNVQDHITISGILNLYRRFVLIGAPGCGKSTLLSYLTLTYARDRKEGAGVVRSRLQLDEGDYLPIPLTLRDFASFLLDKHSNPGKDGPALFLDYLLDYYRSQEIILPDGFFSSHLEKGKAILLLDGMDEIAGSTLRQRVARLVEKFSERYPGCRFIVSSREAGYEGASRIGAQFGLAKVGEFGSAEARQFIRYWTHEVETTLAQSETPEVLQLAEAQAENLIQAINANPHVADLATNPLLLTVIALVYRYRAQLPERRSELYEEAVEVLLGNWDRAKGLDYGETIGARLDSGDLRSLLEYVAFWMHDRMQRVIELDDLSALVLPEFKRMVGDFAQPEKALNDFLRVVNERSGLLIERGVGLYGFTHLIFQQYLAARALSERKDSLEITLRHLADPFWRDVILLEAGYLSSRGQRRVTELIVAIMNADSSSEPEPHYNLLLAAECLFDVGAARVEGDLLGEARKRLMKQADASLKRGDKASVLAKITASNALARLESGQVVAHFWKPPYGEPEWVTIPAGKFGMGSNNGESNEAPSHLLHISEFQIARVPITNAQYALYVKDTENKPPEHWRGSELTARIENHPVVNITWDEASKYCIWLSEKVNKNIVLPSEAEWEKAARGPDEREYPWGNKWEELYCNSKKLGLNDTTPVGLFINGASPYGVLDMSGNVWEWTRSIFGSKENGDNKIRKYCYPYDATDGRETMQSNSNSYFVLRGGSFGDSVESIRCTTRTGDVPGSRLKKLGFRVVIKA